MDIFRISERVSGIKMLIFAVRTILLFGGIYLLWRGFVILWELRPVRKKKYTTVVKAKVTELTQEQRSASMNTYYLPRFEYEQDGEIKAFSPKQAYRPCRLKLGGEVTLCVSEKGKFRTIRSDISLKKAAALILLGAAFVALQIFL